MIGWIDCAIAALVVLVAFLAARICRPKAKPPNPDPKQVCGGPTPPLDGAEIGFVHPLGWPVRIVKGLPVAIGPLPDRLCERWYEAYCMWGTCPAALAEEARQILCEEDTRVFRVPDTFNVHDHLFRYRYSDSTSGPIYTSNGVTWKAYS